MRHRTVPVSPWERETKPKLEFSKLETVALLLCSSSPKHLDAMAARVLIFVSDFALSSVARVQALTKETVGDVAADVGAAWPVVRV